MAPEPTPAFGILLGLCLLAFGYCYMLQKTRLDYYREDLFSIRDELFDYMWQKGASYDLEGYQQLRLMLNGAIRAAGFVSLPTVLFGTAIWPRQRQERSCIYEAIHAIEDDEIRKHLKCVYRHAGRRMRRYIFLEGVRWFIFKPFDIYMRRVAATARANSTSKVRTKRLARQIGDELADEFVYLGRDDSIQAKYLAQYKQRGFRPLRKRAV